ncbi:MAG: response regulator, partial [Parafannyhessea umbonata]|uniref:response regulator n=1 Tax=Parafannyhessea umbonata TaxID=604330 RepID=UPI0026EBE023
MSSDATPIEPPAPAAPAMSAAPGTTVPTILVVEDDPEVRTFVTATLDAHGYAHQSASTGREAIALAATCAPDIILLDLGLPDIDGIEVVRAIRAWSVVPIIVVSARSEDADKIGALDAGADDYVCKPFSVGELLARIRATERHLAIATAARAGTPAPASASP